LSSAEDRTSSTVLSSKASSNSAPEEFPVNPHQEDGNEHGSSVPLPEGPNQIELSASDSPEQTSAEPGEDAATPLKTKPLPKVNAVAREVRVKVTGARVVAGERDLFAESTTTVLVFEKGGVIRLTAAITPGQLLFLTNEESKREVVTQVIRKRDHRPTECYVELEFSEPAPGFWGMEFSAATALLPKDAKEIAAAEMIASAETTDDELDEAAPRPSAEEVEALKREVDALRSQLKLLQAQSEPGQMESNVAIPNAPVVSLVATSTPQAETPSYQTEKVPWAELTSPAFPNEGQPKPYRMTAANQELLPKPALDFHVSLPKRRRSFRARGQFTPGFRTGMLRLALLSSILAALIATAWYKGWLPWIHESKKISVSSWAGGVTTPVSTPGASFPNPVSVETTKVNSGNNPLVSVKGKSPGAELSSETPVEAVAGNEHPIGSSRPAVNAEKPAAKGKNTPPALIAKSSAVHSLPAKGSNSVPTSLPNAILLPPKLIRSERAIASLDNLRDFETGSVLVDAIIDTAGNVTSMKVLSGPPSLRWPALQALKNYKYEPALQNGQPIPAHVTVKIQFHFE
jgi:periplasmic protein TonB